MKRSGPPPLYLVDLGPAMKVACLFLVSELMLITREPITQTGVFSPRYWHWALVHFSPPTLTCTCAFNPPALAVHACQFHGHCLDRALVRLGCAFHPARAAGVASQATICGREALLRSIVLAWVAGPVCLHWHSAGVRG